MRRPPLIAAFILSAAIGFSIYLGVKAATCLCALFFVLFMITIILKSTRRQKAYPIACLLAAVGFGVYTLINVFSIIPVVSALDGRTADVTVKICGTLYQKNDFVAYEAKSLKIGLKDAPDNVKISLTAFEKIDYDIGDIIDCTVRFEAYDTKGFSQDSYYASDGIYVSASIDRGTMPKIVGSESGGVAGIVEKIKENICSRISELLPQKQAALVRTVLLADKSLLSDEVTAKFRNLTAYHLIVVSGLHTSVIGMFLHRIVSRLLKRKKLIALFTSIGVLCYALLTGMTPSVVRAAVMLIIYFWAEALFEKSDPLNSIGIAALLLVGTNPMIVGNMGFQLTFVTTAGIILWAKKLSDFFISKLKFSGYALGVASWIINMLCVTGCATFMMLPYTILLYKDFSPYFLINNLVLTPAIELIVVIGFITSVLAVFSFLAVFAYPVALLLGIICNYVLNMLDTLVSLPFSNVYIGTAPVIIWLGAVFLLIGTLFLISKGKVPIKQTAIACTLLLVLSFSVSFFVRGTDCNIDVLDVNGGTAVLISCRGRAALVCGGADYTQIESTLNEIHDKALTLTTLIVNDKDNFSEYVLSDYKSVTVFSSDEYILSQNLMYEHLDVENIVEVTDRTDICLWNEVDVSILNRGDEIWTYVKTNTISTLICPQSGDCIVVPDDWKSADFAVLSGKVKNIHELQCKTLVLSVNKYKFDSITDYLNTIRKGEIVTTINGSVSLKTVYTY